jgi:O-acetyl-ADP-ribose deacetylase (regulator of RNase III)
MITETYGNLLSADTEAIVNTVNCVGYMGKGIALQFRKAWPENYKAYQQRCRANEIVPGKMFVFEVSGSVNPRFIVNFPTKRHWRGKSRIEDIEIGLTALVGEVRARKIKSIAVPALGCGNGGLDWSDVRPLIEKAFKDLPDVGVLLYPPQLSPDIKDQVVRTKRPNMTSGRALLISLMEQYSALGESKSLLEVQKLAYFLQEAGEDLRLRFQAASYGPYAESLSKVLAEMEGHFTSGFDGSRKPDTPIELTPDAVEEANVALRGQSDALRRLERVANLIEGFQSPYGMELLATTHWILSNPEYSPKHGDIHEHIRRWSRRKAHLFQRSHIETAIGRLREQNWLPSEPEAETSKARTSGQHA